MYYNNHNQDASPPARHPDYDSHRRVEIPPTPVPHQSYDEDDEDLCGCTSSWKKGTSKKKRIDVFTTGITTFFAFVSFAFAVYNVFIMEFKTMTHSKCYTPSYMRVYDSFSFFEFFGVLYFVAMNLFSYNLLPQMHIGSLVISLIQVIFACVIYGEKCFLDDNLSPNTVANGIRYNMIFAFCKFMFNLGLTVSILWVKYHKSDDSDNSVKSVNNYDDDKDQDDIKNLVSFQKNSHIAFNICMIIWKTIIIGCLAEKVSNGNFAYYYIVIIIGVFYTKYIFSLRELSELFDTTMFNRRFIGFVKYLMYVTNWVFIIVLLTKHSTLTFDSTVKNIIYSFEFIFLMEELYVVTAQLIYSSIIPCYSNNFRDLKKLTYDDHVHTVSKFNQVYYVWLQIMEYVSILMYIIIIIMIGSYMDEINTVTCSNVESYLLFYLIIQFFSWVFGTRFFRFFMNEENYDILEGIHGCLVIAELINVIVLINIPCYNNSHTNLSVALYFNYAWTYTRFLSLTDCSNVTILGDSEKPSRCRKLTVKILLGIVIIFTCIGWCVCAGYLDKSGMNKYGVIDAIVNRATSANVTVDGVVRITQVPIYNSIYSDEQRITFLYDNQNHIMNVYDGRDPECRACPPTCGRRGNKICYGCKRKHCGSPFRLQDWFIANYVFIFLNYLIQLLFLISVCCIGTYVSGYIVTDTILILLGIGSVMSVVYSSPDGSLFKHLQSPVKNVLFVHIFLQIPVTFFVNMFIAYIIIV